MTHKTGEVKVGEQMARRLKDIKKSRSRDRNELAIPKEVIKRMEEFPNEGAIHCHCPKT